MQHLLLLRFLIKNKDFHLDFCKTHSYLENGFYYFINTDRHSNTLPLKYEERSIQITSPN